ncbi:substrate-binding periplasmic protein [Parathalassolituus penaei]|uniref:Transporter substrate-binding domain-containing protein n=1 Tax=Parathalassolituus penaei TaxID=2997323 RepID=A0A9X3EDU5_9GAMM|nr:transporter substrate-binding domain-containing protein [Parathalassolituus penaei]MCY0965778.1 transporter substrate-binding domain-containing protein [Parathalassolituus penaei]
MFARFLLLLLLLWNASSLADVVRIAAAQSLPPYIISESNAGAELDVVREALALVGHELDLVYVPFGRLGATLGTGSVQAAFPLQPGIGHENFYFSDVHMVYANAVYGRADREWVIHNIADMGCCSVLAFRQAKIILGDDFEKMAMQNTRYTETALQQSQVEMLVSERIDLLVMDENIFHYYLRQYQRRQFDKRAIPELVSLYRFDPSPYRVAFLDLSLRNDFNHGLQMLRDSGRYDLILQRYFQ